MEKKPRNYIPGAISLIIPGVGQFMQGRIGMGILHLGLAFALWWVLMGWLIHLWSAFDAFMVDPAAEDTDF